MAKNKIKFDPNTTFAEEQQQNVNNIDLSHVQYDPEYDGAIPYYSQNGTYTQQPQYQQNPNLSNGFIDVNNIQKYTQPKQDSKQIYTENMSKYTADSQGYDINSAGKNVDKMLDAMDKFNNIIEGEVDDSIYALKGAIKTFEDSVNLLNDPSIWIPKKNSNVAPQLKKIGANLANALSAYLEKIKQFK
jgi:hypothetical protein